MLRAIIELVLFVAGLALYWASMWALWILIDWII